MGIAENTLVHRRNVARVTKKAQFRAQRKNKIMRPLTIRDIIRREYFSVNYKTKIAQGPKYTIAGRRNKKVEKRENMSNGRKEKGKQSRGREKREKGKGKRGNGGINGGIDGCTHISVANMSRHKICLLKLALLPGNHASRQVYLSVLLLLPYSFCSNTTPNMSF